jgi:hypothetical protein
MAFTPNQKDDRLTKAETVALWHAISNFDLMVHEMKVLDGITTEQVTVEKGHLALAKSALRKVNKLREQRL